MTTPSIPTGKHVLSAIQPSGALHIGNYLGALTQWVALQEAGNACTFPIVDLHAITVPYEPTQLPETVFRTAAVLLAVGIDPKQSTVFVQSQVSAHAEATWLLTTITPVGELERMTQYKDKTGKQQTVGAGVLAYPTLMAADILLYQTDLVPVGDDQLQHLEFTRAIARRFNQRFGDVFVEPQAYIANATARVMSLTDPTWKMSKSDPPASAIALWDRPDDIRKKIRSAVTDSGTSVNPKKLGPALNNLLAVFAAFAGRPLPDITERYSGTGYAVFKGALADLLVEKLAPIRERAERLLEDRTALVQVLARGAEKAAPVAYGTLATMKERMGLSPLTPPRAVI